MNAKKTVLRAIMIITAFGTSHAAKTQDRLYTYTYQSTVLGKGQNELESWHTFRAGRNDFYLRYDNRTEYETGLGRNVQTAFYLNITSKTKTVAADTLKTLDTETEIGFSNEWKWKLSDPVANAIGCALYAEVGIASNEFEVEGKLILDKQAGRFNIAFNAVYEQEFVPYYEKNKLTWDTEQKLEGYLACAFSVSPRFHITLENALKSVFSDGAIAHSALFSGVGMSYNREKFWVNFTVMPQLTSFNGSPDSNLNLTEYEKIQVRLLFAYAL